MNTKRIERPNSQPILQRSRSKMAKQAADPNLYGVNANQGRGPIDKRKGTDGGGIVWAVIYGLCFWTIVACILVAVYGPQR